MTTMAASAISHPRRRAHQDTTPTVNVTLTNQPFSPPTRATILAGTTPTAYATITQATVQTRTTPLTASAIGNLTSIPHRPV